MKKVSSVLAALVLVTAVSAPSFASVVAPDPPHTPARLAPKKDEGPYPRLAPKKDEGPYARLAPKKDEGPYPRSR